MLRYFVIGAIIGAVTGVPIGPVNVAVIDTAYRHTMRRAVAVGLGGSIGDGLYAMLGILVVGPFLERHPSIPPILYALSGVLLLVYGIMTVRSKPIAAVVPAPGEKVETPAEPSSRQILAGFWLGFALIALNPAAVVNWVILVGSWMKGVTTAEGIAATIGVIVGSFAWFWLVAYLATHGKRVLGGKAIWITRIVGYLLIGFAFFSIGRAVYIWFY